MEAAQIYKTEKFADLAENLKKEGYQVKVLTAEVGARGFVGESANSLLKQLSVVGKEKKQGGLYENLCTAS